MPSRRCKYCGCLAINDEGLTRHVGQKPACRAKAAADLQHQVVQAARGTKEPRGRDASLLDLPIFQVGPDEDPIDFEELDNAARQVDTDFRNAQDAASVQKTADIPDEPNGVANHRYVKEYPNPAGIPVSNEQQRSRFEMFETTYPTQNGNCHPFASRSEYGLAKWLATSVRHGNTDEYLKLNYLSFLSQMFDNANT